MPVTKSAAKALRRDRRRTIINLRIKRAYKEAVRLMRKNPTVETLKKAYSQLDRAAKKKVIHKNKAARLKSRLSKLLTKSLPAQAGSPSLPSKPSKRKVRKATKRQSGKVTKKKVVKKT